MPATVQALFANHKESLAEPDIDQILDSLQSMLHMFKETYILLDGLDLVSSEISKTFARIIETSLGQGRNVRLLAMSRVNAVVEDAIRFAPVDRHKKGLEWHRRFGIAFVPRRAIDEDLTTLIRSLSAGPGKFANLGPLSPFRSSLGRVDDIVPEAEGM